MDSNLTIRLRVTHTQNLPSANALADLAAAVLTEALAADPQLLVTAVVQAAAVANDGTAEAIVLPARFEYLRRH